MAFKPKNDTCTTKSTTSDDTTTEWCQVVLQRTLYRQFGLTNCKEYAEAEGAMPTSSSSTLSVWFCWFASGFSQTCLLHGLMKTTIDEYRGL